MANLRLSACAQMPRNRAFLNDRALAELIHYVAVNGENYDNYVRYATQSGWRVFSRRYLHNWVGRHRPAIQLERERHLVDLRKQSLLDRQARLQMAEKIAQELEKQFDAAVAAGDAEKAAKLADSIQKKLQHIAQERGEWNNKDTNNDMTEVKDFLISNMQRGLLKDPRVVEGEVKELDA